MISSISLAVSKQPFKEFFFLSWSCQMLLYYPATEFLYDYLLSKKTFIFFEFNFLSFAILVVSNALILPSNRISI